MQLSIPIPNIFTPIVHWAIRVYTRNMPFIWLCEEKGCSAVVYATTDDGLEMRRRDHREREHGLIA